MTEQADRLRQARLDRGFETARAACDRFGWNLSTYQQHENGTRGISRAAAMKYGKALRVSPSWLLIGELGSPVDVQAIPVIGFVAAGHWLEADQDMDAGFDGVNVSIPGAPGLPLEMQFAVRVHGESLNRIAAPGDSLVCVDVVKSGAAVRDGDLVIVRRTSADGGRHEYTAKRYRVDARGVAVLWPESNDPRYQTPLPVDGADGETIEITGKVLFIVRTP